MTKPEKLTSEWEKELNEYNFCCGGDYCEGNNEHRAEDRKFVNGLIEQARIAERKAAIEEIKEVVLTKQTLLSYGNKGVYAVPSEDLLSLLNTDKKKEKDE